MINTELIKSAPFSNTKVIINFLQTFCIVVHMGLKVWLISVACCCNSPVFFARKILCINQLAAEKMS